MGSISSRKKAGRNGCAALFCIIFCLWIIGWCIGQQDKKKRHRRPMPEYTVKKTPAAAVSEKPAPTEMVLKDDSAAWAEQKQLGVFMACVDDGDRQTAEYCLKKGTGSGSVCLIKRGERVMVVERSDGGAYVRVRRPESDDAWWVSARVLDEPDDE